MSSPKQLDIETARSKLLQFSLESGQMLDLLQKLEQEIVVEHYAPDTMCHLDPRDGALIIYNPSRSKRFHSHAQSSQTSQATSDSCPICEGNTTRIIDIAEMGEGFTFINQNLYPIFHPSNRVAQELLDKPLYPDPEHHGRASYGVHLLQWTSSIHHHDWHNMPESDLQIGVQRLARLESMMVSKSAGFMPPSEFSSEQFGYFSVIKNFGKAAGASLSHGHQQIAFSNIMPRRAFHNWSFYKRHGAPFSQYIFQENPADLLVTELDKAVLLVPYFMRRPLSMMLLLKDVSKSYLHQLDDAELADLTRGVATAVRLMHHQIPGYAQDIAYNIAINNGPGNGIYVEFFPITQITGGFEQVGLWICQERPTVSAAKLRDALAIEEVLAGL